MQLVELLKETRSRIAEVNNEPVRFSLMAVYLWAARVCEVVAVASGSDTTTPYGPRGTDVSEVTFDSNGTLQKAAIFQLKTAKRKGKEKFIALPLDPKYEPWAQPLLDYFKAKGNEPVFPFTRQTVGSYASKAFAGLTYEIEPWNVNGIIRERHQRNAAVHFLRHLRASELSFVYGFRPEELCAYCGWRFQNIPGMSRMMERYMIQTWQSYFPKLLKPQQA